MKELLIGGKKVSNSTPALIIAEVGINHDGKLDQAFQLIDIAAEAGADVVKFQLFTASHMYPKTAGLYKTANGKHTEIYDLIKNTELHEEWIPELMDRCNERDIGFLCTTCDEESTDILDSYGVDAFKIASGEITHLPLFKYTAQKKKTVIFSEGASKLYEIAKAIEILKRYGNNQIALLHCTAEYPAKPQDCNIGVISTYKRNFPDLIIGFSDHTVDPSAAPVQAIKAGAKIIEKHITLDKSLPGADHCFALEPNELEQMVKEIRHAEENGDKISEDEEIIGRTDKVLLDGEADLRKFIHRGIFASKDIKSGERLSRENTIILRPGNSENGIDPQFYDLLIENNVKINKDLKINSPIRWKDVFAN